MKKVAPKKQTGSSSNPQESDLPSKLGAPAERALAEAQIKQLHGVGPNALGKIREALTDKSLSFASENKQK